MTAVFWKKCKKHNTVVALKGETCPQCLQEQRELTQCIGASEEPHVVRERRAVSNQIDERYALDARAEGIFQEYLTTRKKNNYYLQPLVEYHRELAHKISADLLESSLLMMAEESLRSVAIPNRTVRVLVMQKIVHWAQEQLHEPHGS